MQSLKSIVLLTSIALLTSACASSAPMNPQMEPMAVAQTAPTLENNHFQTDRTHNLSETNLRHILESPVNLQTRTRVGVVPVTTAYETDEELPLNPTPKILSEAMEKTGVFDVTTEVSTDWPTDGSVSGLRELAARYRSPYLLLYRHRFVDRSRLNGWAWTYPTVVGIFAAPATTVEVAGVLEATLFDVRTGTILFTVFERIESEETMNIWNNGHKRRAVKTQLLEDASTQLARSMNAKIRRLAGQPEPETKSTEPKAISMN